MSRSNMTEARKERDELAQSEAILSTLFGNRPRAKNCLD